MPARPDLTGVLQSTPDWEVFLEDVDGTLYAHLKIFRWSHRVLRHIRHSLKLQTARLGRPFYALLDPDVSPIKLVEAIGFKHVGYEADANGDICLTYRSLYDGQQ